MRKVVELLCLAMLCAGLCVAQRGGGRGGRGGRGAPGVESEEATIDLFTISLNLEDPQPQKLRAIFDTALQEAKPVWQQIDASKDSLFEAAKSGKNEEEIGKVAAQQANLSSQMMALESQTFAKICRILSNEQQAKVDSFLYGEARALLEARPPAGSARTPPAAPKP